MAHGTLSERDIKIAQVLRPLGTGPLSRKMAKRAGQLFERQQFTAVFVMIVSISQNYGSPEKERVRGE